MHKPPYRQEAQHWLIELKLSSPKQLFNTIDPSPFHEKDLDDAAERYIVECVEDFARDDALKLVIHLPQACAAETSREQLASALANYFGWRAQETRREWVNVLRDGRLSLAIGIAFLVFCTVARQLAVHYTDGFLTSLLVDDYWLGGALAPHSTFSV